MGATMGFDNAGMGVGSGGSGWNPGSASGNVNNSWDSGSSGGSSSSVGGGSSISGEQGAGILVDIMNANNASNAAASSAMAGINAANTNLGITTAAGIYDSLLNQQQVTQRAKAQLAATAMGTTAGENNNIRSNATSQLATVAQYGAPGKQHVTSALKQGPDLQAMLAMIDSAGGATPEMTSLKKKLLSMSESGYSRGGGGSSRGGAKPLSTGLMAYGTATGNPYAVAGGMVAGAFGL